jgi:DNA repair protein RecN (Recombination protein N)
VLTHIHIRDFAIVEALDLELGPGMTVLTGETGAGKSILVDALALALGDRADSASIRHGAQRAEVAVSFEVNGIAAARAWLEEQALDAGPECLMRRVIEAGRSRGFINGRPVPLQSMKELGERLVDIHGQHEHQSLMRRDAQRALLDDYAGHATLLGELQASYRRWKTLRAERDELQQAAEGRQARLELLRYQVQELQALGLEAGEIEALHEEHGRLANAERLLGGAQAVLARLTEAEEVNADHLITRGLGELEALRDIDARLAEACELLDAALIQVREASDSLRHYAERVELDPQRLAWVERRIDTLHELARKHRIAPEELPELLPRLEEELAALEFADTRGSGVDEELAAALQAYRDWARQLSEGRSDAARRLAAGVTAAMQTLGMPGGCFEVALHPSDTDLPSPTGAERVELLVSANPGHPLRPLAKVASGGELSRISLAIQVIAAHTQQVPTLIFDEVDVGIGGGVAETVGKQLRSLGERGQVLCVTHLPQVAAQAHHHLQVRKHTRPGATETGIRGLSDAERVEEIARMLGGIEITEQTVAHAREMVDRGAQEPKGGTRARRRDKAHPK